MVALRSQRPWCVRLDLVSYIASRRLESTHRILMDHAKALDLDIMFDGIDLAQIEPRHMQQGFSPGIANSANRLNSQAIHRAGGPLRFQRLWRYSACVHDDML